MTVPFDCIEFNPALRWIDVMDEVAFTMMDLLHRNHPQFAWRFLNAVLETNGDYAGMAVLRFYLSYRAAVRAKVCAIRAGQPEISKRVRANELQACRSYLALARRCFTPRKAALIITCGLPGSGKTTFSQFVLEQMGAIRIRSDVERKRLHGLSALQSSRYHAGDIYGPEATARTYARLLELARELLAAGFTVIVDAAFLKREEREQFRELARNMSVRFAIASLHAGETILRKRIRQRSNDASEADVAVLEKLQAIRQPLSSDEIGWSVNFTTEEAPDSKHNSINWNKLKTMLESK
jgi:predicted kinase